MVTYKPVKTEFQSTLPARGATRCFERHPDSRTQFQSTLPARGATNDDFLCSPSELISIHAPRTGSDFRFVQHFLNHMHFNPRSPHGERHLQVSQARHIG